MQRLWFLYLQAYGIYTALTGLILTPDIALPALALFNIFQQPIFLFPIHIFLTVNGIISAGRVQKFLNSPELAENVDTKNLVEDKSDDGKRDMKKKSVKGMSVSSSCRK